MVTILIFHFFVTLNDLKESNSELAKNLRELSSELSKIQERTDTESFEGWKSSLKQVKAEEVNSKVIPATKGKWFSIKQFYEANKREGSRPPLPANMTIIFESQMPTSHPGYFGDQSTPVPIMEESSRALRCASPEKWTFACNPKASRLVAPWCLSFNIKSYIVKLPYGIVTNYHTEVAFFVFTLNGPFFLQGHPNRFAIPLSNAVASSRIRIFKKLGTYGVASYPCAYGHFNHEHFPKLSFLWMNLPKDVPILVPECLKNYIEELKKTRVFSNEREIVYTDSSVNFYAAYELYVHHVDEYGMNLPPFDLLKFNENLSKSLVSYNVDNKSNGLPKKPYILLCQRPVGAARWLKNANEIAKRLIKEFPQYDVILKNPGASRLSYREQGKLFHYASLIISPHGGALGNMVWAMVGKQSLIEIGYRSNMPVEYYCVSRILRVNYGLIVDPAGNYYAHLAPNIDEVIALSRKLLALAP